MQTGNSTDILCGLAANPRASSIGTSTVFSCGMIAAVSGVLATPPPLTLRCSPAPSPARASSSGKRRQFRGGARRRAQSTRHNLVFGRSGRIVTMMQSCASAAKLRGDGSNLHSGFEAMVSTSDHRHLGSSSAAPAKAAKSVICCPSHMLSLTMLDVRQCHPILHPSRRDARAR